MRVQVSWSALQDILVRESKVKSSDNSKTSNQVSAAYKNLWKMYFLISLPHCLSHEFTIKKCDKFELFSVLNVTS